MGFLATGLALVALWSPPDPEAVRAALQRVLAERPYQTTLPGESKPTSAGVPAVGPTGRDVSARDRDVFPDRDPQPTPSTAPAPREETRHRTGHASDRQDPSSHPRDSSSDRGSSGAGGSLF